MKTAYLCDGKACSKMCAETMTPEEWKAYDCHHTQDEAHARNKCRRNRKYGYIPDGEDGVARFEKEEE